MFSKDFQNMSNQLTIFSSVKTSFQVLIVAYCNVINSGFFSTGDTRWCELRSIRVLGCLCTNCSSWRSSRLGYWESFSQTTSCSLCLRDRHNGIGQRFCGGEANIHSSTCVHRNCSLWFLVLWDNHVAWTKDHE